jgi:hypothetical protein
LRFARQPDSIVSPQALKASIGALLANVKVVLPTAAAAKP